jgi:hypothetical protein
MTILEAIEELSVACINAGMLPPKDIVFRQADYERLFLSELEPKIVNRRKVELPMVGEIHLHASNIVIRGED